MEELLWLCLVCLVVALVLGFVCWLFERGPP